MVTATAVFCAEQPWLYPGTQLAEPVLLGSNEAGDAALSPLPPADSWVAGRRAVVSFGSNCDAAVLHRKLHGRTSTIVPMAPGVVANAELAASAHVSRPGFIPAAARRSDGGQLPVVVAWLDDEQLRCLDATEPSYNTLRLDAAVHPVTLATGETVSGATLYDTKWGVLALPPPALTSQLGIWREVLRASRELRAIVGAPGSATDEDLQTVMLRLARDENRRAQATQCLQMHSERSRLAGAALQEISVGG